MSFITATSECEEVLERAGQAETPPSQSGSAVGLSRDLDQLLHALSQPMTVLLCTLELAQAMKTVQEIKPLLFAASQASERLRETSLAIRLRLQLALREL